MGHKGRDKKKRRQPLIDRVKVLPKPDQKFLKKQTLIKNSDSEVISYDNSVNRNVKVSAIDVGRSFVESMFTLSPNKPFKLGHAGSHAQRFMVQTAIPLPVKVVTRRIEKALNPLVKKIEEA